MLNKRAQSEIDSFLSQLFNVPQDRRVSTSSAFTQRRDKIKYTAFLSLFKKLSSFYYKTYRYRTYHGYRLIAIDGSVYTLPGNSNTIKRFGKNIVSPKGKWIKGQVSFATDVLNNICVGTKLSRYKHSERKHAHSLVKELGKNNLYLFDRGYFEKKLIDVLAKRKCHFCFRIAQNACKEVNDFVQGDSKDAEIFITYGKELLKVRLTKVILKTGDVEYLLTNLFDSKLFSARKLKDLYVQRWGVEEQFKDMKYALNSENFIGQKVNSILQEFYAKIIIYNLGMMLFKPVIDRDSKKGKYFYKTNKRALLAKIRHCFVELFYNTSNLTQTISNMMEIIKNESVPIRKYRTYPRVMNSGKAKVKHNRAYVSVV